MTSEKDQLEEVLSLGRQLEEARMVPTEHAVHHAKPLTTEGSVARAVARLTATTCSFAQHNDREGNGWSAMRHDDVCAVLGEIELLQRALAAAHDMLKRQTEALREATSLMSKYAREAGEAKGRLEMSEAAGIVDGWRERTLAAEANLTALTAPPSKIEGE